MASAEIKLLQERPQEVRRPVKMWGNAEGIKTMVYFCIGEKPIFEEKSSNIWGTEVNPIIYEASMGQNTE